VLPILANNVCTIHLSAGVASAGGGARAGPPRHGLGAHFCQTLDLRAQSLRQAQVWHLRVDVHVLDHQGNLVDACGLSALAALMAFRRPDVTVGSEEDGQAAVTVHSPDVREPLPLSIHHLPVPVSFAFFEVRRPAAAAAAEWKCIYVVEGVSAVWRGVQGRGASSACDGLICSFRGEAARRRRHGKGGKCRGDCTLG
jgi:hypothetical protein